MSPPSPKAVRYVAIEGPIGVGKTSLARELARVMGARLVLEEVDNPFLARFYRDPERYAFPTQLYFLLTRCTQQRELAQQELFAQRTVADYLLAKDRIFAALNLAPDQLALYEQVYRLMQTAVTKPDLVVFLNARVEVLVRRLRQRNRDFERWVSVEYLEQVAAAYRDFFFYYEETPLLVVDSSQIDFLSDPEALAKLLQEIEHAGPGIQHYVPRS
ncbi:MAG TPA: deoxynucleoside kinase [Candidatus Binataceae bacterium]|nr:deoxynucleoside kinase [Candidatus Binataceae bacterium]